MIEQFCAIGNDKKYTVVGKNVSSTKGTISTNTSKRMKVKKDNFMKTPTIDL